LLDLPWPVNNENVSLTPECNLLNCFFVFFFNYYSRNQNSF
jgi:hypothetical protein